MKLSDRMEYEAMRQKDERGIGYDKTQVEAQVLSWVAEVRKLEKAVEPLNRFPREQWDWMLEYLPDDDNPQYDALRESLDALATINRTSALEASGFRDEFSAASGA